MRGQKLKRRPATGTKQCPYCDRRLQVRGYGRHKITCPNRPRQELAPALDIDDDDAYPDDGASRVYTFSMANPIPSPTDDQIQTHDYLDEGIDGMVGGSNEEAIDENGSGEYCTPRNSAISLELIASIRTGPTATPPPGGDYIRIEYHPNSGRESRVLSPEEFKILSSDNTESMPPISEEPWRPFRSQEDFEFAELVHAAALNQKQIDKLVKFIKRCERNPGSFTFEGAQDVEQSWEDASKLLTPVSALCTDRLALLTVYPAPCL